MNVLWLAWKDFKHPQRGGAEVVLKELINRQVADGHKVTLLTARYAGSQPRELLANGVEIIRVGSNRYVHPAQALLYYVRNLRRKFDVVVETVNTMPYLSLLFRGKTKGLALYHQLARDVWFFESKAPVNFLGYYVIEPLMTWLLGRAKTPLVTVSESTKKDLARFGWDPLKAHIISEGITMQPLGRLKEAKKYDRPTILSFGAIRSMKRTADQIHAFELAKAIIPDLQLKVAGDASSIYGQRVLEQIQKSRFAEDIEYVGKTTHKQKIELMQRSHIITVTSVKEGWGLIVTEAASQGTPAVVYNVDGLRDSVKDGKTGFVTEARPAALANAITKLLLDRRLYHRVRKNAWQWSKQITFDRSYKDFKKAIKEA